MQLLEHEGKALAEAAGITVPRGQVVADVASTARAAGELGGPVMVKAQVPTGGRGRSGGVGEAGSPAEAARLAGELLGTPVAGHLPAVVLVERHVPHDRELYLAVTVDTSARSAVLLLGAHGGVDVEDDPTLVTTVPVAAVTGLRPWHVWQAASGQQLEPELVKSLVDVATSTYRMFVEQRAVLVELNPLLVTAQGIVAADVRVVPEHVLSAPPVGDAAAAGAKEHGFDVVTLDESGEVGLVSTGAGGSLLLVDLLVDAGATPVNFCDLRTGGLHGDPSRLVWLLRELRQFGNLRCIAVNVFAGITDIIAFARTLVLAVGDEPPVPIVVRVEGRGADEARRIVEAAGLAVVDTLDELVRHAAAVSRREPAA